MTIKAVLFDIDGTLVDSNDLHERAWDEAFRSVGARFETQAIHDQIGQGTDMLVPTLLPDTDAAEQDRLGDLHGAIFKAKYLEHVQPFPGARDLLVRVHDAGQQVVWASSASEEELDHYLELLDVRDILGLTTTADDVERTKPAPDIFATMLDKLAPLTAAELIVIGDTPYDVEAAGKCGIATIALRSGGVSDDSAVDVYDDVAALLADFDASRLAG